MQRDNGACGLLELQDIYQLNINENIQLVLFSRSPYDFSKPQEWLYVPWSVFAQPPFPVFWNTLWPTLSPPRFLLHQCTLMKGNVPTMNPVMLNTKKKITTCSTVIKGEEQKKSCDWSAAQRSSKGESHWTVLSTNESQERCHPVRLLRPWGSCLKLLLLASSAPLNARQAESTGYTTWERAPRFTAHPIHTVGICCLTSASPLWWKRSCSVRKCSRLCVQAVLSMLGMN